MPFPSKMQDREETPPSALHADEHRFAIIVGAGAAGIVQGCTFLREKTLPLEEFQILDRQRAYGGVWWTNTYPGAACDIPSNEYCISWALNPCEYHELYVWKHSVRANCLLTNTVRRLE